MDGDIWLSIVLVLAFIVLGGVFAGTEIALVSLREGQLRQLEAKSKRGTRLARLARDPNRFLSAVQIGVTLTGFFSAAYGASAIAPVVAPAFEHAGMSAAVAETVSMILITIVVAYLSLVLGELVPKRLALQRAAGISMIMGPPLDRFATVMRPVIWLLSMSTNLVVRILGGDPKVTGEAMDDEELRDLVAEHHGLGVEERRIVTDVFEAGDRTLAEVMRPRPEVQFFEAAMELGPAMHRAVELPHSRYPVVRDSVDDVIGFVHVRDLFAAGLSDQSGHLGDIARPILPLPESLNVLTAFDRMQKEGHHIAIVVDEYGGTAGIVTLEDLMEELVGDIRDEYDEAGRDDVHRPGEPLEVDGGWILQEFAERTGISLPEGTYETVAGYVLSALGHVPVEGESVDVDSARLEVAEMDGWRIVRLRMVPIPAAPTDGGGTDTGPKLGEPAEEPSAPDPAGTSA